MQRIAYPDNPVMAAAWCGAVRWALTDRENRAVDEFIAATGKKLPGPRSAIARMVDEAAGHHPHAEWLDAFVDWFNVHVWGEDPFNEPAPDEKKPRRRRPARKVPGQGELL